MTILETYCDWCDTPAPERADIGGHGAGQRIRALYPAYHEKLRRDHGWIWTREHEDLCASCAVKYRAQRNPPKPRQLNREPRPLSRKEREALLIVAFGEEEAARVMQKQAMEHAALGIALTTKDGK